VPSCEIGSGEESGEELEEPRCEMASGSESGLVIGCTQL
jgi:hypothetical protein